MSCVFTLPFSPAWWSHRCQGPPADGLGSGARRWGPSVGPRRQGRVHHPGLLRGWFVEAHEVAPSGHRRGRSMSPARRRPRSPYKPSPGLGGPPGTDLLSSTPKEGTRQLRGWRRERASSPQPRENFSPSSLLSSLSFYPTISVRLSPGLSAGLSLHPALGPLMIQVLSPLT